MFGSMAACVARGVHLVRASCRGAPQQVATVRRVGSANVRCSFSSKATSHSQVSYRVRRPSLGVRCSAEGPDAESEPVGAEDGVKLAPITDPDASRKWLAGMIRVWLDEEWTELEVSEWRLLRHLLERIAKRSAFRSTTLSDLEPPFTVGTPTLRRSAG